MRTTVANSIVIDKKVLNGVLFKNRHLIHGHRKKEQEVHWPHCSPEQQ